MTFSPLRIAHRGMPRLAHENTLSSFALALEAGADAIELDVHATGDGVVVVHHDAELDGGMVIADQSLDALRRHGDRNGTAIPTLQEVCELVHGRVELFVEIKGVAIERAVLTVLDGYRGEFALHSFDHALVARIHAIDPTLRLGILFEQLPPDVEALMATTGAVDVWPHAPLITSALVAQVHDVDGRVIAWTVNDATTAARLVAMGVDGLCGDDVRLFPER